MVKLHQFLTGYTRIQVETPFPPRLFNLCARENLLFWGLVWMDATTMEISVSKHQLKALKQLVERQGGRVQEQESGGLPAFFQGFSHRVGFWVGLSLSLFAIVVLSHFVFVLEITGNEEVPTQDIVQALDVAGLKVGSFGGSLKLSQISQHAMSQLEGIAWMSINLKGTRVFVDVRESVAPPELSPTEGLLDLVATVDGMVEALQVHRGEALVAVGDTVTAGQVLVSGNVELKPPLYSLEPSHWMEVPSSGVVVARTWREITVVTPSIYQEKVEKAEAVVSVYSWQYGMFQRSGKLFSHNILFPDGYDKQKTNYYLPRLEEFPFSLHSYKETPYTTSPRELNYKLAVPILEDRAMTYLLEQIGADGEVVAFDFEVFEKEGLFGVTLHGECLEEISLTVEGTLRQPWDYGKADGLEEEGKTQEVPE